VASLICPCEHCFGEESFVNVGELDSALTFCFHITFFTEATVFMATSSKGDNHHARILLPTFAVQFLIAEARGLVFGFLGPLSLSAFSFVFGISMSCPRAFFFSMRFCSTALSCTRTPVLSRTSPASLAAPLSLWLRKQIRPSSCRFLTRTL